MLLMFKLLNMKSLIININVVRPFLCGLSHMIKSKVGGKSHIAFVVMYLSSATTMIYINQNEHDISLFALKIGSRKYSWLVAVSSI